MEDHIFAAFLKLVGAWEARLAGTGGDWEAGGGGRRRAEAGGGGRRRAAQRGPPLALEPHPRAAVVLVTRRHLQSDVRVAVPEGEVGDAAVAGVACGDRETSLSR